MFDQTENDYSLKNAELQQRAQYLPPSTRKRLEQKLSMLQSEAEKVQKALDALNKNPELEAFMETVRAAQ